MIVLFPLSYTFSASIKRLDQKNILIMICIRDRSILSKMHLD